jgi:ribosomal protein S18 acetylase RimI-like enzyme
VRRAEAARVVGRHDDRVRITGLGRGDESAVAAAAHLFDGPVDLEVARRSLGAEGHHLLVAYEDDAPVGFVSGVEMTHPDKGTEMFLYELGVDERFRRRGIGVALVAELGSVARARGCYGMWVVAEDANVAALAVYERGGGTPHRGNVVVDWTFVP